MYRLTCRAHDNSRIVCAGADKVVLMIDVGTGQPIRRLRGHTSVSHLLPATLLVYQYLSLNIICSKWSFLSIGLRVLLYAHHCTLSKMHTSSTHQSFKLVSSHVCVTPACKRTCFLCSELQQSVSFLPQRINAVKFNNEASLIVTGKVLCCPSNG